MLAPASHPDVQVDDIVDNTVRDGLDKRGPASGHAQAFKRRCREANVLGGFFGIEELRHDNPLDQGPINVQAGYPRNERNSALPVAPSNLALYQLMIAQVR